MTHFVGLLRKCEQRYSEEYWKASPENGLTRHQLEVLAVADRSHHVTQSGIVVQASIDRSTVSTMLAILEKKGLVKRERGKSDARLVLVTLTPKGRAALHRARKVAEAAEAAVLASLLPRDREALGCYLEEIAHA